MSREIKYCETDRCGKVFLRDIGSGVRDCERHRTGTRPVVKYAPIMPPDAISIRVDGAPSGTDLTRRQIRQLAWVKGFRANG